MAATFSKDQREFIVRCLASFWSYKKVASSFAGQWTDTRCGEQDVKGFDRSQGVLLPPDLHKIWNETRATVMDDPASAPFADARARKIALSDLAEFYIRENRPDEARSVLRQLAEETGAVGLGAKGGNGPIGGPPVTAIEIIVVDPKPLPEES